LYVLPGCRRLMFLKEDAWEGGVRPGGGHCLKELRDEGSICRDTRHFTDPQKRDQKKGWARKGSLSFEDAVSD